MLKKFVLKELIKAKLKETDTHSCNEGEEIDYDKMAVGIIELLNELSQP